jgi:hypothetical protein
MWVPTRPALIDARRVGSSPTSPLVCSTPCPIQASICRRCPAEASNGPERLHGRHGALDFLVRVSRVRKRKASITGDILFRVFSNRFPSFSMAALTKPSATSAVSSNAMPCRLESGGKSHPTLDAIRELSFVPDGGGALGRLEAGPRL